VTLTLAPFALDQPTSLDLAAEALRSRLAPGEQWTELFPSYDSSIRSARATGGLVRSEGATRGIVLWVPAGPLGVAVRLLYLLPNCANVDGYRALLALTEHAAGPIAFAPGTLAGLTSEQESSVMRDCGFAPFGRSEMAFPPTVPVPEMAPSPLGSLRPATPGDEPLLARLHERAYRDHLDRYLSLEEIDPTRDADRQLRDYFSGRYGELLSPGSTVVSVDGRVVAAALAVRRAAQALIIDVMTDPALQGKGLGRTALVGSLRALRDQGEAAIVLNVTEGNERAVRLYSRLGFIRTLGPSREWYNASRISVRYPVAEVGQPLEGAPTSVGR